MFEALVCEHNLFDVILTVIVLYALYFADIYFTFYSLFRMKVLRPSSYIKYEYNIFIKYLLKNYKFLTAFWLYFISSFVIFTLLTLYVLQPALLIGYYVAVLLIAHLPNYRYIKKKVIKNY